MSTPNSTPTPSFVLGNQAYDVLKAIAQIILPALGTLYFAVSVIWGLPNADKIVGTITAIDVFLGVILSLSSSSYKKSDADKDGELVIDTQDPMKDTYSLEVSTPLDDVAKKDTITLRVRNSN